jgi:hypothetical protein
MGYREAWNKQSYLKLPQVFTRERVERLYAVCERSFEQWKREGTSDGEPMRYCYKPNAWCMIHLNHPKYHRQDPTGLADLLNAVADPAVMEVIREVFADDAVMMQVNYYIDPPGETRIGDWHRDCQFYPGVDMEGQKKAVMEEGDPPRELHMHIPLIPSHATEVVPGTHNRWDTPEELRIRTQDAKSEKMPGRLPIELVPGDLAFFHVNAIHRGMYYVGVPRRTIAVSFGRVAYPRLATPEWLLNWRGYVCTYQPWFEKAGYLDGCTPEARAFYERFIQTYRGTWKREYLLPELGPELIKYFTEY